MKQKDFIFFFKFYNIKKIYIYISILHKKFLKLLIQKFLIMNPHLNYSFSNQKLIFITEDIGFLFKIFSFFQFFNLTSAVLKSKLKKNQINKFNFFKINIQEEKLLLKEESKLKIFRKGRKKYKFKNFINQQSFLYLLFKNNLKKKFKFKNYLYFKNVFPNNNFLNNKFFLNFIFNFFKNYKFLLSQILFFSQFKNFIIFFFIFNSLNLLIRLFYFFFFFKCQQFIK